MPQTTGNDANSGNRRDASVPTHRASWIELLHDPPTAAYTNGFAIMEDPPLVDKEGYVHLPRGSGLGVTIKKELIA